MYIRTPSPLGVGVSAVEIIPARQCIVGGKFSTTDIKDIYSAIKQIEKEEMTVKTCILRNIIENRALEIKSELINRIDYQLRARSHSLINCDYDNEKIRREYDELLSTKAKLSKMKIDDFVDMPKKEFDKSFADYKFLY